MTSPTPLYAAHEAAEAEFIPFGQRTEVVLDYGAPQIEYAATRKAAGLMDCPHRALIELSGADHTAYLGRMLSRDCVGLKSGQGDRMVLLNEKGRIIADIWVLRDDDRTLIDVDINDADTLASELDKFLFSEDVTIRRLTSEYHRLSLHGPKAIAIVDGLAAERVGEMGPLEHRELIIASVDCRLVRIDETAGAGLALWMPTGEAQRVWDHLVAAGEREGIKPLGWSAFNVARLEAGKPIFNIDFGPTNLPHETGIEDQLVSFTKGCYRGQEIVARMQSLGHPAKRLVGFQVIESDLLPVAGAAVYADREVIGAVTSSANSPMRSGLSIGLAMVKWGLHEPGTKLATKVEGRSVLLEVVAMDQIATSTE